MKPTEIIFDENIANRDKFGTYLKQRRCELGLSLRDFAQILKLSPAYIADIEKGNRCAPLRYLEQVIGVLKIEESDVNDFYDLAGCSHSNWPDINQYLADKPNARKAIRLARDVNLPQEELLEMVENLSQNKQKKQTKETDIELTK